MDLRRRLQVTVVALIFLGLFALPALAGVGVWTPLGPDGGTVWSVAVDPDDEATVYAGTVNGVFKSADGGATWASASQGLGPTGKLVWALAATSQAVYAGTHGSGIYRSTDGGATWVSASAGLPVTDHSTEVMSFLVDPRSPGRIWAGTQEGVFLTTNGGLTWQARRRGLPSKLTVRGLAMTPNGRTLYAANLRGVYRSTDQGATWTRMSQGLPTDTAYSDVVVDPASPSDVFVAGLGLWKSTNGGRWRQVAPNLFDAANGRVHALAWQGRRLFALHYSVKRHGIWFSDDHGATWKAGAESPTSLIVADLAAGPNLVYAGVHGDGAPGGVFHSLDRGRHWDLSSTGFNGLEAREVAVDPSDPDVLYAAVDLYGVYKSTDRGATWAWLDLGSSYPLIQISTILVDPADPSTVYAGSGSSGFFRSRDAGTTWETIDKVQPQIETLAADPRTPGAIWAAGFAGLYHWDGTAWKRLIVPDATVLVSFLSLEVDPGDPNVLWAGGTFTDLGPVGGYHLRLLRSGDGGQTWELREAGLSGQRVNAVAVDPAGSGLVLAGTDSGLFRTTDAGLTWTRVDGFAAEVNTVVAAPTTPAAFYVHLAGFGVQRGVVAGNGGITWAPARRGLAPVPVNTLTVDPTDPLRLYAGSRTRGVFTYTEPAP